MGRKLHNIEPKLLTEDPHGLETHENPLPVKSEGAAAVTIAMEEIRVRAETVSPVLQALLDLRPSPDWGLND